MSGRGVQPCAAGVLKHQLEGHESLLYTIIHYSQQAELRQTPEDTSAILRSEQRAHSRAVWGLRETHTQKATQAHTATKVYRVALVGASTENHRVRNKLCLLFAHVKDNKVRRENKAKKINLPPTSLVTFSLDTSATVFPVKSVRLQL